MDCSSVERALIEARDLTEAERRHADACDTCRFLVGEGEALPRELAQAAPAAPAYDLGALSAGLGEAMQGERGAVARVRSLGRGTRLGLFVATLVLEALFFYVFIRRPDFDTYPVVRLGVIVGAYALVATVAAWHTLRPLYLAAPSPWPSRIVLGACLLLPVIFALLPEVPTSHPEGFTYVSFAYYCFVDGSGLAVAALLVARLVDRGAHGRWANAALAAAGAGMVGTLGLQLQCPINYPLHLLSGHAIVPIGVILFYRWFRSVSP